MQTVTNDVTSGFLLASPVLLNNGGDLHSVEHYLISWGAEGGSQMLASAHALHLPTAPCLSILGFKNQGSGLMPKDIQQRQGHHARQHCKFLGFGVQLWAKCPKRRKGCM